MTILHTRLLKIDAVISKNQDMVWVIVIITCSQTVWATGMSFEEHHTPGAESFYVCVKLTPNCPTFSDSISNS